MLSVDLRIWHVSQCLHRLKFLLLCPGLSGQCTASDLLSQSALPRRSAIRFPPKSSFAFFFMGFSSFFLLFVWLKELKAPGQPGNLQSLNDHKREKSLPGCRVFLPSLLSQAVEGSAIYSTQRGSENSARFFSSLVFGSALLASISAPSRDPQCPP